MLNRFSKPINLVLTILLLILIIGALASLVYLVAGGPGDRYTEFYLLGPERKAAGYPAELIAGEPAEVTVGIINHEKETTFYHVEIVTGDQKIAEIAPVSLDDEGKTERLVNFTVAKPGERQRVEFLLYQNGGHEPSNSLVLWVDVRE